MFKITTNDEGTLVLSGRLYAPQANKAKPFFAEIDSAAVIDFQDLEFISSKGLELLLFTQKRLSESGQGLKLINMSTYIRDIFHQAGFDAVFDVEGIESLP